MTWACIGKTTLANELVAKSFRASAYFNWDNREHRRAVLAGRPWFAVEAKLSETEPAPSLGYFGERVRIPFLYQVGRKGGVDLRVGKVRVVSADRFLAALP